jgi:hypothetical protein
MITKFFHLKTNIEGWGHDSSGRAPAYQMQGPEFNTPVPQRKKKNKLK